MNAQAGYAVTIPRYKSEDCNMGDFNAPCNVTQEWVEITISW